MQDYYHFYLENIFPPLSTECINEMKNRTSEMRTGCEDNARPLQAKELNQTQSDSPCGICYKLVEQCHLKNKKFSLLNHYIHAKKLLGLRILYHYYTVIKWCIQYLSINAVISWDNGGDDCYPSSHAMSIFSTCPHFPWLLLRFVAKTMYYGAQRPVKPANLLSCGLFGLR